MNMIETAEIDAALKANAVTLAGESAEIKAARLDLAARNLHHLGVAQTVIGFVELTYSGGVYRLTKGTIDGVRVLAEGAPKAVKPVLADLFTVAA